MKIIFVLTILLLTVCCYVSGNHEVQSDNENDGKDEGSDTVVNNGGYLSNIRNKFNNGLGYLRSSLSKGSNTPETREISQPDDTKKNDKNQENVKNQPATIDKIKSYIPYLSRTNSNTPDEKNKIIEDKSVSNESSIPENEISRTLRIRKKSLTESDMKKQSEDSNNGENTEKSEDKVPKNTSGSGLIGRLRSFSFLSKDPENTKKSEQVESEKIDQSENKNIAVNPADNKAGLLNRIKNYIAASDNEEKPSSSQEVIDHVNRRMPIKVKSISAGEGDHEENKHLAEIEENIKTENDNDSKKNESKVQTVPVSVVFARLQSLLEIQLRLIGEAQHLPSMPGLPIPSTNAGHVINAQRVEKLVPIRTLLKVYEQVVVVGLFVLYFHLLSKFIIDSLMASEFEKSKNAAVDLLERILDGVKQNKRFVAIIDDGKNYLADLKTTVETKSRSLNELNGNLSETIKSYISKVQDLFDVYMTKFTNFRKPTEVPKNEVEKAKSDETSAKTTEKENDVKDTSGSESSKSEETDSKSEKHSEETEGIAPEVQEMLKEIENAEKQIDEIGSIPLADTPEQKEAEALIRDFHRETSNIRKALVKNSMLSMH